MIWETQVLFRCLTPNLRKLSTFLQDCACCRCLTDNHCQSHVFPSSPSLLNKTFPPRMGAEFYYMLFLHPLKWHVFQISSVNVVKYTDWYLNITPTLHSQSLFRVILCGRFASEIIWTWSFLCGQVFNYKLYFFNRANQILYFLVRLFW